MTLKLVFAKRDGGYRAAGPVQGLRFEGDELRDSVDGRLIARHVEHHWLLDGERFMRVDCQGPLHLTFTEDGTGRGKAFGAFGHLSSMDGILFADREVLAHLDMRDYRWYLPIDDSTWPALLVAPASR